MSTRIALLLNKGVDFLSDGGTVEAYLQSADRARLSLDEQRELEALLEQAALLLQLGRLRVVAPRAKASNRARFLSAAAQQREEAAGRSGLRRLAARLRFQQALAGLVLALCLLFAAGAGAVSASASSLPGSMLYPVKLAAEDLRLALTTDPITRAHLYMRFANQRGSEIVRLAETGQAADRAVLARMSQQWQGALQSAQSVSSDVGAQLLQNLLDTSSAQADTLRQAVAASAPETQPALNEGAAIAEEASQQAQQALSGVPAPTATPESVPTDTESQPATLTDTRVTSAGTQPPAAHPAASWTPPPSPLVISPTVIVTLTLGSETQTSTATARPGVSSTPVRTPSESTIPRLTPTPSTGVEPSATPLPPTATVSETPKTTRTPEPSATPQPSETARPSDTPQASFRLTNEDTPDPVPATHRIHYVLCVINEGQIGLSNVLVTDTWSPRDCVYYLPGNPQELSWELGTVEPGARSCVAFSLNTYSICGGRTVNNVASMTCDQGTGRATQQTHIDPTPVPSLTATLTPTVTSTVTPLPTSTSEPTLTATLTVTATPSPVLTFTATVTATAITATVTFQDTH